MKSIIEVQNVSKTLNKRKVIQNMTFNIMKGDICGFIGPNGAGKTTLMKMATGLIKPNDGEILINGIDVQKDREKALSGVGAIIEVPVFFEYISGRKNLRNLARLNSGMDRKEQLNKVEEVLELVGLKDRGNDLVKNYSLGMKQRLGIAQSLLNNPSIVILDEPSNGLDPVGMKDLRELILSLAKKFEITFFISSHLLDELQKICNKYIFIKEGCIKWVGDADCLLMDKEKDLEEIFLDFMA
ncbi:ABC transporter ATP-binding protein [Lysinibacillus pakistanensis]|uniref:ATP-binding cassette domain-containing protein n=1 Tax=Lysinibacillus pakistanensis TaxID=759811 RepID=A0AAX3WUQ5_9BACI|nr:ATP-binding cassette domain-containing protein [Lysinibacillus pakistanensis]MDM5230895.1 ATP-binding cassette domain-containing protein [Lysinibacillus pakistanensis]WHY46461.1 ATP-binding cassette domain-containing protein [Lysinibacillus pakistanensis]WHY51474.1 ATP-binding cassette domain-containing protein [Lysinibacillus pakistanensis]